MNTTQSILKNASTGTGKFQYLVKEQTTRCIGWFVRFPRKWDIPVSVAAPRTRRVLRQNVTGPAPATRVADRILAAAACVSQKKEYLATVRLQGKNKQAPSCHHDLDPTGHPSWVDVYVTARTKNQVVGLTELLLT